MTDHTPAPAEPPDPAAAAHNARLGLALFALYLVAYAGYVAVNAVRPAAMDAVVVAGLNLAVVWGLGLIAGAFALALVYAAFCQSPGSERP